MTVRRTISSGAIENRPEHEREDLRRRHIVIPAKAVIQVSGLPGHQECGLDARLRGHDGSESTQQSHIKILPGIWKHSVVRERRRHYGYKNWHQRLWAHRASSL